MGFGVRFLGLAVEGAEFRAVRVSSEVTPSSCLVCGVNLSFGASFWSSFHGIFRELSKALWQ